MIGFPNISIVGLTGFSGAGKSTASKIFANSGFLVIDCDEIARNVAKNPLFLSELAQRFSPKVVREDNALDRAAVSEIIFRDDEMRRLYGRIIYPYITYDIARTIRGQELNVLLDAPTLYEARLDFVCDAVVAVLADKSACARRIAARDGISPENAAARLSAQHDADFFRGRCDYVIENNKTEAELFAAVNAVITQLGVCKR